MPRTSLTVRLDHADALKITEIARGAGLSHNQVAAAFIKRALAAGWTVKAGSAPVVTEG